MNVVLVHGNVRKKEKKNLNTNKTTKIPLENQRKLSRTTESISEALKIKSYYKKWGKV